jgi:D-alanine-D-alanine ligase-like ATP-grasp enzyme
MYLKIRTKNHTAQPLKNLIEVNTRAVFRLGSITPTEEIFPRGVALNKPIIEINTAEACHNSGDKILMKECFDELDVKSAPWCKLDNEIDEGYVDIMSIKYVLESYFPAIVKHKNSCKGNGIFLINDQDELDSFIAEKGTDNYIIEKYYNYSKEYRLHVTKDGCFYTCRKMLKENAEERWHRHDTNSVWIMEENELFEKPSNWNAIVDECVKALNAVGLDIGACDIKVQSEKNHDRGGNPEFIILEINSGPSMGDITLIKYEEQLRKMLVQ